MDCAQSAAWYTLWYGAACSSMASVTMAMNDWNTGTGTWGEGDGEG